MGFSAGAVAQVLNFQHDFAGVEQLQVAASQALVRAVHKQQFVAHDVFGSSVGHGRKHQQHTGGGRVLGRGA